MQRTTTLSKRNFVYIACTILLTLLPAQAEPTTQPTTQPVVQTSDTVSEELNRSTPRDTIESFLVAMDEFKQGKTARTADLVACLDISGLPKDLSSEARHTEIRKISTSLAQYLGAIFNEQGESLTELPASPEGNTLRIGQTDTLPGLEMVRDSSGKWVFAWDSLSSLLEAAKQPAPEQEEIGTSATADASSDTPTTEIDETRKTLEEAAEQETEDKKKATDVPQQFRSPRATLRTFRDAMLKDDLTIASDCLDIPEEELGFGLQESRRQAANALFEVMRRVKQIVPPLIPNNPEGEPFVFWQGDAGYIVLHRMPSTSEKAGQWLFTPDTVSGADEVLDILLTQGVKPIWGQRERFSAVSWLREAIPPRLHERMMGLKIYQWIGIGLLLPIGLLVYALGMFIQHLIGYVVFRKRTRDIDSRTKRRMYRPVSILAVSGLYWVMLPALGLPPEWLAVLLTAVKFVACWATVWTLYRAVDLIASFFDTMAERTSTRMDDVLIPLLRKAAKVVITIFGILFIIQEFSTEPPTKLIAGVGLGGLAFALAAQDTIRNIFGSITVLIDQPFKVGDWVVVGDKEGTVETVGFRSTRIRTFYNSLIIVPNSNLIGATVDNYGARQYRRMKQMISVTYSTPAEKIDAFCEGIRELILLHPYMRKDYYHVYLNKFEASSLDILLYCFFEVPDWSTELNERHKLMLDIIRLAQRLGVEFAFPTQTIWLENSDGADERISAEQKAARGLDSTSTGIQAATQLVKEVYGQDRPPRNPVVVDMQPRSKKS